MISDNNEQRADRPIRNNFNAIVFVVLGVMALAIVLAMAFVHLKKPNLDAPPTRPAQAAAQPK